MSIGTVYTGDGTTAYASMRHYPPEKMGRTFATCVECEELGAWLLLGYEDGQTVGVPLCQKHTQAVRWQQGL